MITLHDENETKLTLFENNGLGILKDCISAEVTEEINGDFSLEIEYPKTGRLFNQLKENMIIVCDVGYGEEQAFRIRYYDLTLKTKKIFASHIFYDLADNLLEDVYPKNLSGASAGNWILSRTQYNHDFTFSSDVAKSTSARYVRKNPVEALIGTDDNSFINRWGGEIERNNFAISIINKRQGLNKKKYVRYRKNLKGLTYTLDFSTVVTRAMPVGYDGLLLPERYVDSPLINNYFQPIIKTLDYPGIKIKTSDNDEEGFETEEEAFAALREAVQNDFQNGIDKPAVSSKIDFVKLSDTEEYRNFKSIEELIIGDTINVHIEEFNLDVDQRIVKTTYNVLTQKFTRYELGTVKANYANQSVSEVTRMQQIIMPNLLDLARQSATNQITKALGGYVYKTSNELFIMDTDKPETAIKVWRWNLNGLGYSSSGIDGPYELALTQDGQIVADFIKTGTMSVDRIEGLSNTLREYAEISTQNNRIMAIVSNMADITREVEEDTTSRLILENCMKGNLLKLRIKGNNTVFKGLKPTSELVPGNELVPSGSTQIRIHNYNVCSDTAENWENASYSRIAGVWEKVEDEATIMCKKFIEVTYGTENYFSLEGNYVFGYIYAYDEYGNYLRRYGLLKGKKERVYKFSNDVKYVLPSITQVDTTEAISPEEITEAKPMVTYSNEKLTYAQYHNKNFDLGVTEELREYSDTVYDELIYDYEAEGYNTTIIRRVGVTAQGTLYELAEEAVQRYSIEPISLGGQTNYIDLQGYTANMYAKYVRINDFTKQFATTYQVESTITQLANQMTLLLREKIGKDEVIAEINLEIAEGKGIVTITGNQIVIDSDYFHLTAEGEITSTSGEIGNWLIKRYGILAPIIEDEDHGDHSPSGIIATNILDQDITDLTPYDIVFFAGRYGGRNNAPAWYITNSGKCVAKWFEVNGESGYFYVNYDSGKRALAIDKDGILWRLDDAKNDKFAQLWCGSDGTYLDLYDSPGFYIWDAVHESRLLSINRYRPENNVNEPNIHIYPKTYYHGGGDESNIIATLGNIPNPQNISDRNVKKNIKPATQSALDIIKKLNFVEFDWDNEKISKTGHTYIGLITQDLEKIDKNYIERVTFRDNEKAQNLYGICLLNLLTTTAKAVQEFNTKITFLEEEIKNLKGD